MISINDVRLVINSNFVDTNLFALSLVVLIFIGLYLKTSKPVRDIPLVRGGYPIFGHVFEMIKGSPWDTMTKWSMQFNGIYQFHLFGSYPVCVTDPDLIKVIFSLKLRTFHKDVAWTYKPFMDILGRGIVTSEGKDWFEQRKLLSHHLRIDILELIPKMAIDAFHRFQKKLDSVVSSKSTIEMAEEFRHITLQVIAEALVSLSPEESDENFARMYLPIVEEGNARTWNPERMYIPSPSWFKYKRDVKILNDYVTGLIVKRWELRQQEYQDQKNRNKSPQRAFDVLDKILGSFSLDQWNDDNITFVRDAIKTFVLAGHETSASMLSWTLYEISLNPDCMSRVRQEVDDVFDPYVDKSSGKLLEIPPRADLQSKLVYTECCLREALRKYSVVPIVTRLAAEDVSLGKYHLAKGQTVMILMQGVHHNPKFWPEPMEFKPERFLNDIEPYTFLPFIEGARTCLGQYLSLLESKILLSLLVKYYTFETVNPVEAGMKHNYMVPIIPKTGHLMRVSSNMKI